VAPLGAQDAAIEQADHLPEARSHLRSRRGPVEVGVALHDVQVGVHGLGRIQVPLAQAQVARRRPVAGPGLDVAAPLGVAGVGLDPLEGTQGGLKRLGVARGQVVLAEGVDAEGLAVGLLGGVRDDAVGPDGPDVAAVLRVGESLGEGRERTPGQMEVGGVAEGPEEGGEGEEQAGVEDQGLVRLGSGGPVRAHLADEAAVLLVDRAQAPEGEQVASEVGLDGPPQLPRRGGLPSPLSCHGHLIPGCCPPDLRYGTLAEMVFDLDP
jgi:hypothetical protein